MTQNFTRDKIEDYLKKNPKGLTAKEIGNLFKKDKISISTPSIYSNLNSLVDEEKAIIEALKPEGKRYEKKFIIVNIGEEDK